MDPQKMREAFGLPADATDAELAAAMETDPDLAAYRASRTAAEPGRRPWMELESAAVSRTALELLELWAMARPDAADFELTKITALDRLSHLTATDVARTASAVAALAVHVLTAPADRAALSERIVLELATVQPPAERS